MCIRDRSSIDAENQPVGADAGRPVAEIDGEIGSVCRNVVDEGDEEVVSEAVVFGQVHGSSMAESGHYRTPISESA